MSDTAFNSSAPSVSLDFSTLNLKSEPKISQIDNLLNELTGLEKLNNVKESLKTLAESNDTIQSAIMNLNSSLIDFTIDSKKKTELEDFNSEIDDLLKLNWSKHMTYSYIHASFLPQFMNVLDFELDYTNQNLCAQTRLEMIENKKYLEKFHSLFKENHKVLHQLLNKLREQFGYPIETISNFSSSLPISQPNVDPEYAIIEFYVGTLLLGNKISPVQWQENRKILNNSITDPDSVISATIKPTIGYPEEVKKIYQLAYSDINSFAQRNCKFPSNEGLRRQAFYILSFLLELYRLEHFNKIDYQSISHMVLNEIAGPDHISYISTDFSILTGSFLKNQSFELPYLAGNKRSEEDQELVKEIIKSISKGNYKNLSQILNITSNNVPAENFNLCVRKYNSINWDNIKDFFKPFGSVININSKRESNTSRTFDNSSLSKNVNWEEFLHGIENWPNFYSYIKGFIDDIGYTKTLNGAFDAIYQELVNSIFMCGQSLEVGKIDTSKLRFPTHISFRDCSVLLQLQTQNVSSLPSVFFMNDFCFSPISILLVLYSIGYFQEKEASNNEQKYFYENLTSQSVVNNVIIIKLIDFVMYLGMESANKGEFFKYGNFIVNNQTTWESVIGHVFTAVTLLETAIDFTHRTGTIKKDFHLSSKMLLDFYIKYTTGTRSLSDFKSYENLNSLVEFLYSKNSNRLPKPASKIIIKHYNPYNSVPLTARHSLAHLCIHLNGLNDFICYRLDNSSLLPTRYLDQIRPLTWVPKYKCKEFKDFAYYDNFFFKNYAFKSDTIYLLVPLSERCHFDLYKDGKFVHYNFDIDKIAARQFFYYDKLKYYPNNSMFIKFVEYNLALVCLNVGVNFEKCLDLSNLLDAEYGKENWHVETENVHKHANNMVVDVNYSFIDNEVKSTNHAIDEYIFDTNNDSTIYLIVPCETKEKTSNIKTLCTIENVKNIYKKCLLDKVYEYDHSASIEHINVIPFLFQNSFNIKTAGTLNVDYDLEKSFSTLSKLKRKLPTEFNYDYDESTEDSYKADDLIIINELTKYIQEMRNELVNFDIESIQICKDLIVSVKLRLLENIAMQHFTQFPHFYFYSPKINNLAHFNLIKSIYYNSFTIEIEKLNELIQKLPDTETIQLFKSHYKYMASNCEKYGYLTQLQKGRFGYFNMHITALYIYLSCAKKLAESTHSFLRDDLKHVKI
jgi:hypothetical protein